MPALESLISTLKASLFIIDERGRILCNNEVSNYLLEELKPTSSTPTINELLSTLNSDWKLLLPEKISPEPSKFYLPYIEKDTSSPTGIIMEILPFQNLYFVALHSSTGRLRKNFTKSWENIQQRLSKRLAHDFNNIITSTFSLSDLFSNKEMTSIPLEDGLKTIKSNAQREHKILDQALNIYNQEKASKSLLNIVQWINDNLSLIEGLLPNGSKIEHLHSRREIYIDISGPEFIKSILILAGALGEDLTSRTQLNITTRATENNAQIEFNYTSNRSSSFTRNTALYQAHLYIESIGCTIEFPKQDGLSNTINVTLPLLKI